MKSLMAAASVAVIGMSLPVVSHAQTAPLTGVYGNLGYSDAHSSGVDLGAIQGRLGYRANNWLGVEGELAGGVKSDKVTVAPGVDAKVKLKHEEAIYGVGFLPVAPNWDLLARVGYGHTKASASASGVSVSDSGDSWNLGAGAQYHFDGVNGIRADYTRQEFQGHSAGHADVWSLAYSRRF